MDIPFPLDSFGEASIPNYTVLFDNCSSASIPLDQMAGLIPPLPILLDNSDASASLLPPFLRLNSKIPMNMRGNIIRVFLVYGTASIVLSTNHM